MYYIMMLSGGFLMINDEEGVKLLLKSESEILKKKCYLQSKYEDNKILVIKLKLLIANIKMQSGEKCLDYYKGFRCID